MKKVEATRRQIARFSGLYMALLLVLIVAGGNSETVDSDRTRVSSKTWVMEEDNKNRRHQVWHTQTRVMTGQAEVSQKRPKSSQTWPDRSKKGRENTAISYPTTGCVDTSRPQSPFYTVAVEIRGQLDEVIYRIR